MKTQFARFILRITGWKLVREVPAEPKFVGLVAPHTSNWDFVWGKLAIMGLGIKGYVLTKKELFFFPLGIILRAFGAKAIDRSKSSSLIRQVIGYFHEADSFILFITPEGTRSKTSRWKPGFHFIARNAQVPVYLTFIDYRTKRLGLHQGIALTEDVRADINRIKEAYSQFTPKFPENFSTEPQ